VWNERIEKALSYADFTRNFVRYIFFLLLYATCVRKALFTRRHNTSSVYCNVFQVTRPILYMQDVQFDPKYIKKVACRSVAARELCRSSHKSL
jgi:hypothetical protein